MKKYFARCLMLGAFLMALMVLPMQAAYALGHKGGYGDSKGGNNNTSASEPAIIALLGSGLAGIGVYNFMKRKNRK
jgi:hypothetical protein